MAEFDEASSLPTFAARGKFDEDAFLANLDRASQQNGGPKVTPDPSMSDILRAAFNMSNTLGSLSHSQSIAEAFAPTHDSQFLDFPERFKRLTELGLSHHANLFATGDMTENFFNARVADLQRELSDRKTLQSSGGIVAELAAGLLDPINLIPIAGGAAEAGAGIKAVARAGAVTGAGAGLLQELPLQASQVTRTPEQGAVNVGMSTILGAGLGLATDKILGPTVARRIVRSGDEAMTDLRTGGQKLEQEAVQGAELQKALLPERHDQTRAATDLDKETLHDKLLDALFEEKQAHEKSAGARSALTPSQQAEIESIAKENPHLDRADITDSVLASYGELGLGKIRPGLQPSAAGAVQRLRGKLDLKTNEPVPENIVTPDRLVGWLKELGVKDAHVKTTSDTRSTKTSYVVIPDPTGNLPPMQVRIPSDGHPGRPLQRREMGGRRIDTGTSEDVRYKGYTPDPTGTENVEGGKFSEWENLVDALKWRLSRAPDGQFLIAPGKEPLPKRPKTPNEVPILREGPNKQLNFDLNAPRVEPSAKSAGAAGVSHEDILAAETLRTSDRMDARLAGIPMDKLLQNFGKIFSVKIPFTNVRLFGPLGDGIAQGLRNPRMEMQRASVNLVREVASKLDQNPFPLKSEGPEGGHQLRTEHNFHDTYSVIEGGHAQAIKEIEGIWAQNKKEFDGSHDAFGKRVYFAAIKNGVDDAGSVAVQKAANVYRHYVFNPIQKLFIQHGMLREGVNVHGADSYVPWAHVAQSIVGDRDNFLKVHSQEFAKQLEQEFTDALARKSQHLLSTEKEAFAIEAEHATKIEGVLKKYNGDENNFGKIREAQQDKDRLLGTSKEAGELDLERSDKLERAKSNRDNDIAAGKPKQAVDKAYNAELVRIAEEYGAKKREATIEADKKIADTRAARDAEVKSIKRELKQKVEEIRKPKSDLDRAILRLGDPKKRVARADDLALKYYEGAVSGVEGTMPGDTTADILMPSVLKARRSPIIQEEAAKKGWAETNIFDLGHQYARSAGSAASMAAVFKKPLRERNPETGLMEDKMVADLNLNHVISQIEQRYDDKIQIVREHGGTPEQEVALRQEKTQQIRNIEIMRDGTLGRRATVGSKAIQEAGDLARQFNSIRLMGGTVAASLGDPFNIAMANGFANTWRDGMVPALQNFKAYMGKVLPEDEPAIMRMNRLAGAVIEREQNSRMGALMDLHNPGSNASTAQSFMYDLTKQFWNYTGLTAWTQWWKNIAAGVFHGRVMDAATRGWGELSGSERTWLTNLRIDENMLGRIGVEHTQQPEKFSAGIPYANFETWKDREAADRFAAALNSESKNIIVTPTVGDKLAFQATPVGQMIAQFRTYGISAQARLITRNIALNSIDGDKTGSLYTGLFALGLMGAVVDGTKFMLGDTALDGMSKKDPTRRSVDMLIEKWQQTPGEQAYNSLDRTGFVQPIVEISNIMQKLGLPNIQGVMSAVAQDKKDLRSGSSRMMHRSVLESMGGPTVGLMEELVGAARLGSDFGRHMIGMNEAFKPSRRDITGTQRLIPFQNLPGIQQILNTGQQKLGTLYDWPRE